MNVYKHFSEFIFDYCINNSGKKRIPFSNTKAKGQRWGSWLSAIRYYSENLPAVLIIFHNLEGGI